MRFDKRKPAGSDITRLTLNVDGITDTISRESPVRLTGGGGLAGFQLSAPDGTGHLSPEKGRQMIRFAV